MSDKFVSSNKFEAQVQPNPYLPPSLHNQAGFKKTMAFQPRVIRQNRGSAGEGIWSAALRDDSYLLAKIGVDIAPTTENRFGIHATPRRERASIGFCEVGSRKHALHP